MAVMTRRLHMGCGETLQSHLPESFTKLTTQHETRQLKDQNRKLKLNRKGPFWK